jgi:hypothetical protein
MINKRARAWLQEKYKDWTSLWDDNNWALCISPYFDRCKRSFDGQAPLQMLRSNDGPVIFPPFVPI